MFVLSLMISTTIIVTVVGVIAAIAILMLRKTRRNIITIAVIFVLASSVVYSVDYFFHHVLERHQKERINVLLGKETDLKGAGYNVNQSLIAIGSGGFLGKGFLNGTQTKFDFVPEQSTDFIFCTVGEEWGFVGAITVILLYSLLLWRIWAITRRTGDFFGRLVMSGFFAMFAFHVVENIGMNLGLLPVTGIPLPLISYGGSSSMIFALQLGIVQSYASRRADYDKK